MRVHGPHQLQGAHQVNAPNASKSESAGKIENNGQNQQIEDTVDISDEALQMQAASDGSDIRWEKVNAVRAQIEAGAYETQDKLEKAIERLLDDIA